MFRNHPKMVCFQVVNHCRFPLAWNHLCNNFQTFQWLPHINWQKLPFKRWTTWKLDVKKEILLSAGICIAKGYQTPKTPWFHVLHPCVIPRKWTTGKPQGGIWAWFLVKIFPSVIALINYKWDCNSCNWLVFSSEKGHNHRCSTSIVNIPIN